VAKALSCLADRLRELERQVGDLRRRLPLAPDTDEPIAVSWETEVRPEDRKDSP
jgi:hypothetical protein